MRKISEMLVLVFLLLCGVTSIVYVFYNTITGGEWALSICAALFGGPMTALSLVFLDMKRKGIELYYHGIH